MKTLILTESNWRCGRGAISSDKAKNERGKGYTELRSPQGYMCCLGQFTSQLKKGVKILGFVAPNETEQLIPFLTRYKGGNKQVVNTKLSDKAIEINDDIFTTVETKVKELKKLFKRRGIKIIFKKKK